MDQATSKVCTICGTEKPLTSFTKRVNRTDGRCSHCVACVTDKVRVWRAANPEKHLDQTVRRYGITGADYLRMSAEQGGTCAICRNPETMRRRLAVDHCHVSGAVRSLLCAQCNGGLGTFKDRPDILRAAADYLEQHHPAQGPN